MTFHPCKTASALALALLAAPGAHAERLGSYHVMPMPAAREALAALRAGAGDDAFLVGEVFLPAFWPHARREGGSTHHDGSGESPGPL